MRLSLKSTSITFYISWGSMIGTSFQIGKNKTYTIWTAASSYYVRNSPKWLLCPTNLVCWSSQIPKISWSSTTRPKMAVTPPPCHEFTKSCKNSSHLQDGILDGWAADIPFTLLRSRCYFRVPNLYLGHCTISWYHHYTCSNNLKIGSLEKWH